MTLQFSVNLIIEHCISTSSNGKIIIICLHISSIREAMGEMSLGQVVPSSLVAESSATQSEIQYYQEWFSELVFNLYKVPRSVLKPQHIFFQYACN